MKRALLVLSLALCGLGARAGAQTKHTLRLATVVPDGTAWARELRAFAREISEGTQGEVQVKLYFGSIAGDDMQVEERIRRDQLDGVGSAGPMCEKMAPTFRGLRLPGFFQQREQVRYVAGQLRRSLEQEAAQNGFNYLGHAVIGPLVVFSRETARSMAELKRTKLWVWEGDDLTNLPLKEMGFSLVPLSVNGAASAYTEGRIDGWITTPATMMAFQWSSQARYVTEVSSTFLLSCLLVTTRALDKMPIQHQQTVRAAAAKLAQRLEDVSTETDQKLLGGAFTRLGMTPVKVGDGLRTEYQAAARAATEKLGSRLVPTALMKHISDLLGEYHH